jgi:hypothetical protein
MRGRRLDKTGGAAYYTRPTQTAPRRAPSRANTLRAHGAPNKSHHVCGRRRDGEVAGTVSGREQRRCLQIVCRSRMALLGQTPMALPASFNNIEEDHDVMAHAWHGGQRLSYPAR